MTQKSKQISGHRSRLLIAGNLALVAMVFCAAQPARAEHARFYNLEGFGTWLDGNPEGTAVTEDGDVVLAPTARDRYQDAAVTFSAATVRGDDVIVARVDDGQVLAIDRAGKTTELFKAEETLVTALVADGSTLYIAVGPPAKIYRIQGKGAAKVWHTPDAGYIWDMTMGPSNDLYVATGEPGGVLRVDSKGHGSQVFAPEETHVRSLAWSAGLGVFAGGGEKGIVYRSRTGRDDYRALYDSGHIEVTSIVLQGQFAFVAAVTGAEALVSEQGNEDGGGEKGKGPEVRSQLTRVAMDGTAEVLAGSSDEAIFDLAVDDKGHVVVATGATGRIDPRGRLYTVEPTDRLISMTYQSASKRITHLLNLPRNAMAAVAAAGGRVIHLAGGYASSGKFLTNVFDATINAQFGMLEVFGNWPKGTRVEAAVRSGQTAEPDATWSDWSNELEAPGRAAPQVANGRYMQVRLTLHGDGKQTPSVHRVRLAYLRRNLRPFIREVVALRKGLMLLPILRESSKAKTISLSDKTSAKSQRKDSDKPDPKKKNGAARARQIEKRGALTVKWSAEDPNGDEMTYDLQIRARDKRAWTAVDSDLSDPFFTMQAGQYPDGHYQFRVRATDQPSNPDGQEQSDTRESRSILIDNNPPQIDPFDVKISGRRVSVRTVVADAVGPLMAAEYSIDGGEFRPAAPDDGVLDGPGESFTLHLGELSGGAHSVTLRVTDEGDNESHGEARFVVR